MAKVHTSSHRKTEISTYRAELGKCIERARNLADLNLDQFAREIGRDSSQVGKWIRNAEPPQLDVVLMSSMRGFMLQALAERTPGCEVTSVITFSRRAS